MNYLEERNQKIIDAVIKKAETLCPGSLALIGINGSFMTGDYYEKSDLDLLIVINDQKGQILSRTFIQEDLQVGHDIYCVDWDYLKHEAAYMHPNISKLLDAVIVYAADEAYKEKLETLRKQARDILNAPFSKEDFEKAAHLLTEAEHYYVRAMLSDSLSEVRQCAGGVIYYITDAMMMLNKQYYHLGVKRAYSELEALKDRPENFCSMIENVISALSSEAVKARLTTLMKTSGEVFLKVKGLFPENKKPAGPDTIGGTYEEMVSNWRNKVYLAASEGNRYLSFMSLTSANGMFEEIRNEVDIDRYDSMSCYDPEDLQKTAEAYDKVLKDYLKEYKKAGVPENRYPDVEAFVEDYVKDTETKYSEPGCFDEFLEESEYVDHHDPSVQALAETLRKDHPDELALIKETYEYVRDQIYHSWDVQDTRVTVSASDVLREGVGICWAKANLLAALLRANGIPAGFSYQRLTLGDTPDTGYCIHALNTIYVSSLDKWIRLDARGNKEGIQAEFSTDEEILAFPIRSEGEVDYRDNHARPDPGLMKVLKESTDALDMYLHHLPDQLSYTKKES